MATRTTVQRSTVQRSRLTTSAPRTRRPGSAGTDHTDVAEAPASIAPTDRAPGAPGAHTTPTRPRGERPLQPAHVANARILGQHGCACTRSPRAIAHWLLVNAHPSSEPTDLALDGEEAALWSNTLTGRLKIEHTSVNGACSLHLAYTDGRSITIAMDQLRLAAIAAA